MDSRKFSPGSYSNLLSTPQFSLEPVRESAEHISSEMPHYLRDMLQKPQRASRLQRLSIFLPTLKTNIDSKRAKETQPPPLPSDPASPLPDRAAPPPPSRLPPSPPQFANDPVPPISSKKPQKSESPSRIQPLPRALSRAPARLNTEGYTSNRSSSLAPPPIASDVGHNRSVSSPVTSRPVSNYHSSEGEADPSGTHKLEKKRKSWLGGGRRSRNASQEDLNYVSDAWVNAGSHKIDYNLSLLINGEKVPELWDEAADTFVYLFPRASGRGPSFRVPSMALSSSLVLINYINGSANVGRARARSFEGRASLSVDDATRNLAIRGIGTPPYTPKTSISDSQSTQSNSDGYGESIKSLQETTRDIHLYFPTGLTSDGTNLTAEDIQILVGIRNLFAFLTGQPLVGTRVCPSIFRIFLAIGDILRKFQFTNIDGSTFGESASASFEFYLDELRLADVSTSREKTVEGIILGESMRSAALYTEAFTHAVGKYSAVREKKFTLFQEISPTTRALLERASLDLAGREASAATRLNDFDYPSLFSGIAASTSTDESKYVRFKAWKSNYMAMRKHVLSYYKDLHGQWPPKASSKKNSFVVGGLNRLVLKGLYADMCSLYDLMADRTQITTRSYDASEDGEQEDVDRIHAALRKLLGEFDRSSPPVQPPVPYDAPLVPSMTTVEPGYPLMSPKDQHKQNTRKLKDYETTLLLTKAHNMDVNIKSPFLDSYKVFEERQARGKNAQELADQTYGHWVFLYAVIQSLPLLAVDVQGLRYTEGVEYFLCMPPPGNLPWVDDAPKTAWYGVQGGQHVVSLPSYLVDNGVEAVYRRSHCWTVAERWIGNANGDSFAQPDQSTFDQQLSPLAPPPGFGGGELGVRPQSRDGGRHEQGLGVNTSDARGRRSRQSQRQSIALGLERLPIPMGLDEWTSRPSSRATSPVVGHGHSRNSSGNGHGSPQDTPSSTGATFDQILGSMPSEGKKAKGKKK
ncbi:hypothetical protein G7Y89_g10342 [Cudoniella acicularis]|uniref:DUF8004 domain-containing protein n=1 Tax=Cudoniella acicularis TaxID=354080 RepID=A0A8H4W1Q7_9HELO|nr:hypothetical protein G7Y89_g10342 [Cudoniella acicularis]